MIEYYNGTLIIDMLEYYMIEYYNGTLIYRYVGVLHVRVL